MYGLTCAAPKRLIREGGRIRVEGWRRYAPERVPALWRRIADLGPENWLSALQDYGALDNTLDAQREEAALRRPWERTITRLGAVAVLWTEAAPGVWELPMFPPAPGVHALQFQLARVAADNAVHLVVRGTELAPEPTNLDAYLWMSAAESLRDGHRFKHCERCGGWFAVRRHNAQFCGPVCRNKREIPEAPPTERQAADAG